MMSNRPFDDDPFDDDDDLFGDDFDDADDFGGQDDTFRDSFDDADADPFADDFGDDADLFGGGLDEDEDLTFEDQEEPSGPSRTFIYIAGAMILLFVIALIALVLISLGNTQPTPIEQTATAIFFINSTTVAQGLETATASFELGLTQTVQANLTATELARPTETPTPSPSPTVLTPTPDLTEMAGFTFATQTQAAVFAAQTQAALPTNTVAGPPTIEVNAVALTATALANLLQPTIEGSGGGQVASPTAEGGPVGPLPTALPDTGLFDDLAAGGSGSLGGLVLAIMGLLGVIVISRRLRAANG
jgi:hypothetical protein